MLSPWNTEKTEINLLNTVMIFLQNKFSKDDIALLTLKYLHNGTFFTKHLMKHRSGISVRASTQPGVSALPVSPRLPQPFSVSKLDIWDF